MLDYGHPITEKSAEARLKDEIDQLRAQLQDERRIGAFWKASAEAARIECARLSSRLALVENDFR